MHVKILSTLVHTDYETQGVNDLKKQSGVRYLNILSDWSLVHLVVYDVNKACVSRDLFRSSNVTIPIYAIYRSFKAGCLRRNF